MYLFRGGENHAHNAADSEVAAKNMQAWMAWMGGLAQKGILVGAEPLLPDGIQVSGKEQTVSEGPYVQANESVGGYLIVNAKDMNEAIEISKGCPIFAENGKVEIRQDQKMEM